MSKIPKFVFDQRAISASRRMMDNAEKGLEKGLTKQQADALARLAKVRHDFHTNTKSLVYGGDSGDEIKKNLLDVFIELQDNGLGIPEGVPLSTKGKLGPEDYIDIYSKSDLEMIGEPFNEEIDVPMMVDNLYNINLNIEKYLGDIDEKYGTSYKPTGTFRNF